MEKNKLLAIFLLDLLLWFKFGFSCWFLTVGTIILLYRLNKKNFELFFKTLPRDFRGVLKLFKVKKDLTQRLRENLSISDIFVRDILPKYSRKPAFIDVDKNGEIWTFSRVDSFSNQVANYFHSSKLVKENDRIALFMNNCPEYGCMWLGLSRLGVVSALINFNLRLEPLGHSIRVSSAKFIIVSVELQGGVLSYIYTSGTTGLPKAAVITHARFYYMARGLYAGFGLNSQDRIYVTMPMYHSAAGILGLGQTFLSGCTLAIRKKFSASNFWKECIQYECTAGQYIGEICRYLLAQPSSDNDRKHKVRIMYGNGLRPQIWGQFVRRFGIQQIGEFYGSTEGNTALLNLDNTQGSCGFMPLFGGNLLRNVYPVVIVKVDETTGEIIRNSNGMCIPIGPGDSGEIIGKIVKGDPVKDFSGYVNTKDTEKKLVHDVLTPGDTAFSSGDILHMDELGYLSFKDRTGDTFRWKGENVSTGEVEGVLSNILSLCDATVYGVEIPGMEGRAGMAAIVDPNENCNLDTLVEKLKLNLPPYARPVFLRMCKEVEATGTYKLKKTDLRKAGFDLDKCEGDPIYYINGKSGKYERVTPDTLPDINSGKIKF